MSFHSLPFFEVGKDVLKDVKGMFVRAIEGEVQRTAVTTDIKQCSDSYSNFRWGADILVECGGEKATTKSLRHKWPHDDLKNCEKNASRDVEILVPGKSVQAAAAVFHLFEGFSGGVSGRHWGDKHKAHVWHIAAALPNNYPLKLPTLLRVLVSQALEYRQDAEDGSEDAPTEHRLGAGCHQVM